MNDLNPYAMFVGASFAVGFIAKTIFSIRKITKKKDCVEIELTKEQPVEKRLNVENLFGRWTSIRPSDSEPRAVRVEPVSIVKSIEAEELKKCVHEMKYCSHPVPDSVTIDYAGKGSLLNPKNIQERSDSLSNNINVIGNNFLLKIMGKEHEKNPVFKSFVPIEKVPPYTIRILPPAANHEVFSKSDDSFGKMNYFYNVIIRGQESQGPKMLSVAPALHRKIVEAFTQPVDHDVSDLVHGCDLDITANYHCFNVTKKLSSPAGELNQVKDWLSKTSCLYINLRGDCSNLRGNCLNLRGDCSNLRGDCSNLRGDCSGLVGDCSGLVGDCSYFIGDCTDLVGDCSNLKGDCTDLVGNCSNLKGDCTGLVGDCSNLIGIEENIKPKTNHNRITSFALEQNTISILDDRAKQEYKTSTQLIDEIIKAYVQIPIEDEAGFRQKHFSEGERVRITDVSEAYHCLSDASDPNLVWTGSHRFKKEMTHSLNWTIPLSKMKDNGEIVGFVMEKKDGNITPFKNGVAIICLERKVAENNYPDAPEKEEFFVPISFFGIESMDHSSNRLILNNIHVGDWVYWQTQKGHTSVRPSVVYKTRKIKGVYQLQLGYVSRESITRFWTPASKCRKLDSPPNEFKTDIAQSLPDSIMAKKLKDLLWV